MNPSPYLTEMTTRMPSYPEDRSEDQCTTHHKSRSGCGNCKKKKKKRIESQHFQIMDWTQRPN